MPRVLIVGQHSNYLLRALPRLFAAAGAELLVASPPGSAILSSRYIHHRFTHDPDAEDTLDRLEHLITRHSADHVIVLDEPLLHAISIMDDQRCPNLKRQFQHLQRHPIERTAFHRWAVGQQIPVPEGRVVCRVDEALEALKDWTSIYLKRNHTSGGKGVFQLRTAEEIRALWSRLNLSEPVLVQQALTGRVGVCEMVCARGQILAWNSSEKWRTLGKNGPSVARRLCVPPGMDDLVRAVATATGFHGLCGFDWVIDENEGRAKMIEFHPRPPSGFGIGHWAGVFFDRAIAALLRQESVAPQRPNPQLYRHHDVCCYFPDHPLYCWKMKDWQELQRWLPWSQSHSWAMLPWDDPTFLVHTLRRLLVCSSPAAVHKNESA